jgi:photosystem II stability/assembly factor-like uncharacterized protein
MNQPEPTFDELPNQDADLVYAFSAAANFLPGKSGAVFAARSSGLYRSQDGGLSWEYALDNLSLTETLPVTAVALSPAFSHDGLVLAGAPGGLFHSTDTGQNWKALIFPNPPPTVSALAFSPNFEKDETVFAGTMEDGVFISQNGGERWVAWNFGLLDLNVMSLAISPAFQEDETIFTGTETGIFRSTNGGRAWREVDLPFGYEAVLSLAISTGFATDGTLYAGTEGQGLWVTRDAGETWQRLGESQIEDPVNSVQISGRDVFAFTSTAVWHSTDGGETWTDRMPEDLAGIELSAALAPSTPSAAAIIAGLMDGSIETIQLA